VIVAEFNGLLTALNFASKRNANSFLDAKFSAVEFNLELGTLNNLYSPEVKRGLVDS
jgi:hypothetical protein